MCITDSELSHFLKYHYRFKGILWTSDIIHFLTEQKLRNIFMVLWLMFKLDANALFSLPFIINNNPSLWNDYFPLTSSLFIQLIIKQKHLTTSPPPGGGCAVLVFPVPRLLPEIWKSWSARIREITCSQHGQWTAADRWCNMYRNYWQGHLEMFTAFWHCCNIQMQWYKHIDPWPIGNKTKLVLYLRQFGKHKLFK